MVIQITLNPDGETQSNDSYTVELFKKIDDGSGIDFGDFSNSGGSNVKWMGIDGDITPIDESPYEIDDPDDPNEYTSKDMLITPIDSSDTLNNDNADIGVSNEWIGNQPGEGIRIDFVYGINQANGEDESDPWNVIPYPYSYNGHYESNNFTFTIIQTQPANGSATVVVSAINADDDYQLTGDSDDLPVFISKNDVRVESLNTINIEQSGNNVIISGLQAGDKLYFETLDSFDRVLIANDDTATENNDDFALGGFEVDTARPGSPVSMDFDVEVTDADGDTADGDFTVTLDSPVFVVGKNVDDTDTQTVDHAVSNPNLDSAGEIIGGSANDILIGDIGGSSVAGKDANIVLVLDVSTSMTWTTSGYRIDGPDGYEDRLTAMKRSLYGSLPGEDEGYTGLLYELAYSDAENVRVHIVGFGTDSTDLGTYDLRVNGEPNETDLNQAKADVLALDDDDFEFGWDASYTNYESGLDMALAWTESTGVDAPLTAGENTLNQTIFISDGEPNAAYTGNGIIPDDFSAGRAIEHILGDYDGFGSDDTFNEVAAIENGFGDIEAIGIQLGDTALNRLDQVEGEAYDSGVADNIETSEELVNTLLDVSPISQLSDVGGDVISGEEGDDIIFGDAMFTDTLATEKGIDMNPGSGYLVFKALENGESSDPTYQDWDRADTILYINENYEELSRESVITDPATEEVISRQGGDDSIDAGRGNDTVYAQEGNDTVYGGTGDDFLDGGSGADELFGDAGDDILIYEADPDDIPADSVLDGGDGYDIFRLENGEGIDFSLMDTSSNPISNIEEIDMLTDSNSNFIDSLSAQDVLDITDGGNVLTILGGSNDSVSFEGGSGTWDHSIDDQFHVYTNGDAVVRIENDITDIT